MENADGNDVIQNGHGKQGAGHRTFGVEFLHDGERRCRSGRQCNAAERQREIQRRHHHCLAEQPCKVGILPEEIHADVKIAENPALRAAVPAVGKMLRFGILTQIDRAVNHQVCSTKREFRQNPPDALCLRRSLWYTREVAAGVFRSQAVFCFDG